jgi:hypothetical protein
MPDEPVTGAPEGQVEPGRYGEHPDSVQDGLRLVADWMDEADRLIDRAFAAQGRVRGNRGDQVQQDVRRLAEWFAVHPEAAADAWAAVKADGVPHVSAPDPYADCRAACGSRAGCFPDPCRLDHPPAATELDVRKAVVADLLESDALTGNSEGTPDLYTVPAEDVPHLVDVVLNAVRTAAGTGVSEAGETLTGGTVAEHPLPPPDWMPPPERAEAPEVFDAAYYGGASAQRAADRAARRSALARTPAAAQTTGSDGTRHRTRTRPSGWVGGLVDGDADCRWTVVGADDQVLEAVSEHARSSGTPQADDDSLRARVREVIADAERENYTGAELLYDLRRVMSDPDSKDRRA